MTKRIYVDMDDTIADFGNAEVFGDSPIDESKMYEPGFFRNLKPIDGALVAVRRLIKLGFDVQILTQPVAQSPHSYSEKVEWIGMYFPELIPFLNMVQNKGVVIGDYLIDDNSNKWKDKFEANGGKFIKFHYKRGQDAESKLYNRKNWEEIVEYFEGVVRENRELKDN